MRRSSFIFQYFSFIQLKLYQRVCFSPAFVGSNLKAAILHTPFKFILQRYIFHAHTLLVYVLMKRQVQVVSSVRGSDQSAYFKQASGLTSRDTQLEASVPSISHQFSRSACREETQNIFGDRDKPQGRQV
ncbi:uncharacterized protein [Prorops nasuta]|uniref:uncharacterized protein n=1 Tax=Prorops nasuta TaxID=863751 RepID=UPI0034CF5779